MLWNILNVFFYRQKVYGVTGAKVSVGYQHTGCSSIIWEHQTVKVAGHDLDISNVGGFNLHVHHAYNFHEGKNSIVLYFKTKYDNYLQKSWLRVSKSHLWCTDCDWVEPFNH